jgi:hypothetical protein
MSIDATLDISKTKELIQSMARPKTEVTTDDGDGVGGQLSWWCYPRKTR